MTDRDLLHLQGYALLSQAVPPGWLDELRTVFDAGVRASDQWPVPRGSDWRHSQLDDDARVHACHSC